ncbi:MAG: DNA-directed RNA polymerase subunit omega [Thermoanaerobaculia bacterium]
MTESPETTPPSPQIESKFRLVHIASRRAEQLMLGARPKLETKHSKYSRIALDEVAGGLVKWQLGRRPSEMEEGLDEGAPVEAIDPLPLITP